MRTISGIFGVVAVVAACAGPPGEGPVPESAGGPPVAGEPIAELRATSTRATLRTIELIVEGAAATARQLELAVAFENTSATSYGLGDELWGGDFRLADAGGPPLEPLAWSAELDAIVPAGGFPPGARKDGRVIFPRPSGPPPYVPSARL